MTEKEYLEYLKDGEKLFTLIADNLNKVSDRFIRLDGNHRNERDFKEICVALGLLANIADLNVENI